MKIIKHFIILIIFVCLFNGLKSDLNNILDEVEQDLKKLLKVLNDDLPNRCNYNSNHTCSSFTCSTTKPELVCSNDFILNSCQFEDCDPVGHLLNTDKFMVRLANEKNNEIKVTKEVKAMVNGSYGLHAKFKEIFIKPSKAYNPKWMYFGTYNGVHMSYPGKEVCRPYDNRYRPWYLGTVAGVDKNIIIVIDTSGAMLNHSSYKDILIEMFNILMKSILSSDRIGFITFNITANSFFPRLVLATDENLERIRKYLSGVDFTGQTNLESAFEKVSELINDTAKEGLLISCKTNIILFTYGSPTAGILNKDQFIDRVKNLSGLNNVRLFAYTFSNDDFIKEITCFKNGVYEYVERKDNLYTKLNSYFTLISIGSNVTEPVWAEAYTDSSGLGKMTTCSIPVYDKINNALSGGPLYRIYGVISIDILIKDFSEYGSEDEINKELRKRTINVCSTSIFEPTECQLNSLRTNKCNNINTSCSGLDYLIPQCDLDNIPNKLFCNEKDNSLTQDNITYCCENLCKVKGALIGGLIGGIVGLIVIVILVWYFMCRKKDDDGNNNKGETPKLILVVKTDKQLSENKNLTTSDNVKEKTTSENLKTNENPQNGIKNENPIIDTKGSQNISPKPISNNSYVNKDHVNIDNGENNDQNNNKNDSDINISRKNSNDRKFPPHIFEMDDHQL